MTASAELQGWALLKTAYSGSVMPTSISCWDRKATGKEAHHQWAPNT
jgi:hypothetical protein